MFQFIGNSSPKHLNETMANRESNFSFYDRINPSAIQIAIDWDPTALHLRYQSTRERVSFINNINNKNQ